MDRSFVEHNQIQDLVLDDVYDIWYTSFWQTPLGYAILIFLALVLFLSAWGVYKLIENYRASTKERTLRQLRALAEKVRQGRYQPKRVYQQLTDAVKSYITWHYSLPRGTTDSEVIIMLKSTTSTPERQEQVKKVFDDAQRIKFGPTEDLQTQAEADIASMISFVEETAKSKK